MWINKETEWNWKCDMGDLANISLGAVTTRTKMHKDDSHQKISEY